MAEAGAQTTLAPARAANVVWFLRVHGDSRYLGTSQGARGTDFACLKQIAPAADHLGYYGVLIPSGRSREDSWCEDSWREDSWIVASVLAGFSQRLRFLVAVRPGLLAPAVAARMTATFDRISGGRVLINAVTGGDTVEGRGGGFFADHAERRDTLEVSPNLRAGTALVGAPDTFSIKAAGIGDLWRRRGPGVGHMEMKHAECVA